MTVRRLLTTSLLFIVSLFLMAFQEEPAAPETTDMIPALIWILLLLVGVGLLLLAWGRRDVDAFSAEHEHHDAHGHGHEGDDHAHHDADTHKSLLGIDGTHNTNTLAPVEPEIIDTHTEVVAVPPVVPMGQGEPFVPAIVEVPDDAPEVADVADVPSPSADVALADADEPVLAAVEIPEPTPAPVPMSAPITEDDVSIAPVATEGEEAAPLTPDSADETAEEPRTPSSSIGMRDRPTFKKVDIPDTLPAAEGSVRDTMEFRMGEDNPGEIVQRPATGDRPEPTPMSMGGGGLASAELDVPELDVPNLGLPALDAASSESAEPDTEAVPSIAPVGLEAGLYEDSGSEATSDNFGDTPGLNGGDMVQKMGVMEDSEPASSGTPGWFIGGGATPATSVATPLSASTPSGEWETTTLEPPNTAEGATALPVINLPAYDSDLSGAPKWLVTGAEDDDTTDDLQIIEGIGPKIASILNSSGIRSFRRLAGTGVENLREILDKAGISHIADPTTWGEQAQHAAEGAMDKLQELQERLKGGRKE